VYQFLLGRVLRLVSGAGEAAAPIGEGKERNAGTAVSLASLVVLRLCCVC